MTTEVLGYAALSSETPLVPFKFERRTPREDDVVIQIEYCGVCHSDLHQAKNDWGFSAYPLVRAMKLLDVLLQLVLKSQSIKLVI